MFNSNIIVSYNHNIICLMYEDTFNCLSFIRNYYPDTLFFSGVSIPYSPEAEAHIWGEVCNLW